MSTPDRHVHAPADLERISEEEIRALVKADLVEVAVDLLDALRLERSRRDRANRELGETQAKVRELETDLASAESRVTALEESLAHERARVDALAGTGVTPPATGSGDYYGYSTPSLTGEELAQALAGLGRLTDLLGDRR